MSTPLEAATEAVARLLRTTDAGLAPHARTREIAKAALDAATELDVCPECLGAHRGVHPVCPACLDDRRTGPADRRDPTKNTHTARLQQRMNHGRRSTDQDTP